MAAAVRARAWLRPRCGPVAARPADWCWVYWPLKLYHTTISLLLFCRYRPNGRDAARKQRVGLSVRCALLAQQFVHRLLIDWSSALRFAEEAVDEVRRPLSCR